MRFTKTAFLSLLFIFCFFSQNMHAQTPNYYTRIDLSFGGSFDIYQLSDPGGRVDDGVIGWISGGLDVNVDYSDHYSIGGGLIAKAYSYGVHFKSYQTPSESPAMSTLQIPLHLRARASFGYRKQASVFALGGAALAINLDHGTGPIFESANHSGQGNDIRESTEVDVSLKKTFPLVFIGGGVDFPLLKEENWPALTGLRFGFSARRFFGFSDVMKVHIDYTVDNMDSYSATENYRGGYWMFNMHLLYAIKH